ncbi:MAG: FAD-binding oxidoreductase [Rhodovibrionaceae bacterium]
MPGAYDIAIVGGGIAGATLARELAGRAKVVILEAEQLAGYHSTGRSAAIFIQNYGNTAIRALSRASRSFFEAPPHEVAQQPLFTPRGILFVAQPGDEPVLREIEAEADGLQQLTPEQAGDRVAILRRDKIAAAAYEADASDIDVAGLHQGCLRAAKAAGAELVTDAQVHDIAREGGQWRIAFGDSALEAKVVVNAAGAWADGVARLAGLAPLGLIPLRRSAAILPPPRDCPVEAWPLVSDAAERYYFKPDAGRLMVSPADETPVDAHDAFVDDMVLAEGLYEFELATTYQVQRVEHQWAGLRTFAPDRSLVIGYDPAAEGFFWLAGQGGYGIQTSPAAARAAASLLMAEAFPAELAQHGLEAAALSPGRLR